MVLCRINVNKKNGQYFLVKGVFMLFVSNQKFKETPDTLTSVFTTQQNYQTGTLWIFQGNLVVESKNFIECPPNQIHFIDSNTQKNLIHPSVVSENTFELNNHGYNENNRIVVFGNVMPEGILKTLIYYVHVVDENNFQVSLIESGDIVQFISNGDEILSSASPYFPDPETGSLWYNAFVDNFTPASILVEGLWSHDVFCSLFQITRDVLDFTDDTLFVNRINFTLHSASTIVRSYLLKHECLEYYADAKLDVPNNKERSDILVYVEGLIALKILFEEPGTPGRGPATERIEKFTDAVQITERYQGYGSDGNTTIFKKSSHEILSLFLDQFLLDVNVIRTPYVLSESLPDTKTSYFEDRLGFEFRRP